MYALLDFLPLIAFFIAFKLSDFRTAVVVIMIAMVIQVAVTWIIKRTVNRLMLASAILVVLLGGIGLILKNDLIFKWKPTVLNGIIAVVLLASQFIGDKPAIQRLLEPAVKGEINLSGRDWRLLNLMWVGFFLITGAANLYVAYHFSENIWVNFKVYGIFGLTALFVVLQAVWLARRANNEASGTNQGN